MKRQYDTRIQMLFFIGIMIITAVGCVPRNKSNYDSSYGSATYSQKNYVAVEPSTRRYYRDENGRLYHVDPKGGLRVIERQVRVEQGTGGLFTIIDNNNTRYYYDETGRLYYRDDIGNIIYVEESDSGKVIDPLPILRGDYSGQSMRLRSPRYCTGEWNTCLNHCEHPVGLGNKRACFEQCDFAREQCLRPY